MRQKFSYIVCMMFMLFGTSQIVYGAAIAGELTEDVLKSTLEGAGRTTTDIGEAASKIAELGKTADMYIKDEMLKLTEGVLGRASEEEIALVRSSIQKDIVSSLVKDGRLINFAPESTEALSVIVKSADKAGGDIKTALKNLKPSDPRYTQILSSSAELDAAKASGRAVEAPVANAPGKPLAGASGDPKPMTEAGVINEGQSARVGLPQESPKVSAPTSNAIQGATAQARKFLPGKGPNILKIGQRRMEEVPVTATGKKLGDIPDAALRPDPKEFPGLTDDTIMELDGVTGKYKPIENPKLAGGKLPEGLSKYKKVGDPEFELNTNGSIKVDKAGKPIQAKVVKPALDDNGQPVKIQLKDMFGDSTAGQCCAKGLIMLGNFVKETVKMLVVQGMVMGMAFSVPPSMMSGFIAERQAEAALATMAAPIAFGGITMQIPDELINVTMPTNSLKIYAGIPVVNPAASISTVSTPDPSNMVVGPDGNNQVSQVIKSMAQDQFKAFLATIMSAANEMKNAGAAASIPRYTFYEGDEKNASYYDKAHLFCSWSSQSWTPWASSAITDPGFSGLMIDLNTGYVFAQDGTTEGNAPVVLLGSGTNGAISVQTFLSQYAATLNSSGKTFDFAEYTSGGQPDVETSPGSAISRQFSAACIVNPPTDKPAGGNNSGFGSACMVGNFRNSVLATSLLRLAAGTCIDQFGKELTIDQVAANAANAQVLAPTTVTQQNQSNKAAKAITKFYDDPKQQANFAMQSTYESQQSAFALSSFQALADTKKAAFAQAAATTDQQQTFIDTVYNSFTDAQQSDFAKATIGFKDTAEEIAYLFDKATPAQQQNFISTVFNSQTSAQLKAFIQNTQYVPAEKLQTFLQGIFKAASQNDKDVFAQNSVIALGKIQSQAQANSQGTSGSSADQVLRVAVAKGALGGVVPIYGFDNTINGGTDTFETFLKTNFSKALERLQNTPGGTDTVILANQTTTGLIDDLSSGAVQESKPGQKVSANSKTGALNQNLTSESVSSGYQGAPNINYPAFGVYIYECANTPFAVELKKLTNTPGLDYIVFFDEYLNCVPLQVVAPNPHNFNLPDYQLNPAIAYWTSLICYMGEGHGPLDEFMGRYKDPASGNITTFFPLYTLNGKYAYVQNAEQAVQAVLSNLQSPQSSSNSNMNLPELYNQIQTVAKIEVATYQMGPFYKPYNLVQADQSLWMSQQASDSSTGQTSSIEVVPYVGVPPYPMPLSLGSTTQPTDYLVPFVQEYNSSTGKNEFITVELPNPYVAMFVSLVSDIVFAAQVDKTTGNTTFVPTSYQYSQYNPASGIDASKPVGVWLNNFKNSGCKVPSALITEVSKQRAAWLASIESDINNPTYNIQKLGFPFGHNYSLAIVNKDDYTNKNYMYTCPNGPSGISQDLYVMSASAALPNPTVGLIADVSKLQPYIVSMATGFMYDNNGNPVKDGSGKPVNIDTSALLALVKRNQGGAGPSADTNTHLAQLYQQGQALLQEIEGPYEFGSLLLHLYKIDVATNNYVYFMLDQANRPSDYFVVVKSTKSPFSFGGPIDGSTQNMVSLITGQLYTRTGTAGDWPNLSTLLASVQNTMSISAADLTQIKILTAAFEAQQKAEADEKSNVAAQAEKAKALILEDLGNIAQNVITKPYLPAPYDTLVQDTDGKYYRVTPDADGNPYMIFDFNATTDSKDSGNGAIFLADQKGTFVTLMQGIYLTGMRQHFGVQVGSDGKQTLSIPHIAGNMNLNAADQAITPGQSGTALIVSTDPQFPTPGISTVTSGSTKYYFYYHTFLHSYFVYVVNGAEKYYVSMEDGTEFNTDGSARILHYQIARDSNGNPMVISQDFNGMLRTTFADPDPKSSTSGKYINFWSDPKQFAQEEVNASYFSSFPSAKNKAGIFGGNAAYGTTGGTKNASGAVVPTSVWLYQDMIGQDASSTFNPNAQTYLLFVKSVPTDVFIFDATSQVQSLTYVPVNSKTGQIITTAVNPLLKSADLIMKNGVYTEVIFNGVLCRANSGGSSGTLTFTPVSGSGGVVTVKTVAPTPSCAGYVLISQGTQEYMYSYAYQRLSSDDFTNHKQNIWKLNAAMDPNAKPVLCKEFNPKAKKPVTINSVANVPDAVVSGVTLSIQTLWFDQASGKYFAEIKAADYNYFGQDGFVDIENGCFYDGAGTPYGYSLSLTDYLTLLNKLNVMVIYNTTSRLYNLVYRSAQLIQQESANVAPQKSTSTSAPAVA